MKPGEKQYELVRHLATGARLHRFTAERRPLHDHVLNTSISNLTASTGIVAERQWIKLPCVRGTKSVRVKQYWLAGRHLARARKLLTVKA